MRAHAEAHTHTHTHMHACLHQSVTCDWEPISHFWFWWDGRPWGLIAWTFKWPMFAFANVWGRGEMYLGNRKQINAFLRHAA